jgi:hypothetical protein
LEFLVGASSDGLPVVEAELEEGDPAELVALAREHGAALLWVHSNADLASFGFTEAPGYARLRAEHPPPGEPLPPLAERDYAATLDVSYRGLWGHKQLAPTATPPEHAVVLGLYAGSDAIGLTTVFEQERLIDGPGVVPDARTTANYVRLLLGACALLGPGPIDLDSWGDDEVVLSAYGQNGFEPIERVRGWELRLD